MASSFIYENEHENDDTELDVYSSLAELVDYHHGIHDLIDYVPFGYEHHDNDERKPWHEPSKNDSTTEDSAAASFRESTTQNREGGRKHRHATSACHTASNIATKQGTKASRLNNEVEPPTPWGASAALHARGAVKTAHSRIDSFISQEDFSVSQKRPIKEQEKSSANYSSRPVSSVTKLIKREGLSSQGTTQNSARLPGSQLLAQVTKRNSNRQQETQLSKSQHLAISTTQMERSAKSNQPSLQSSKTSSSPKESVSISNLFSGFKREGRHKPSPTSTNVDKSRKTVKTEQHERNGTTQTQGISSIFKSLKRETNGATGMSSKSSEIPANSSGKIPEIYRKWKESKRTRLHDSTVLQHSSKFVDMTDSTCACSNRFPSKGCRKCNAPKYQWSERASDLDVMPNISCWLNSRQKRPWLLVRPEQALDPGKFQIISCKVLDCPPLRFQTGKQDEQLSPGMTIDLILHENAGIDRKPPVGETLRIWAPWAVGGYPISLPTTRNKTCVFACGLITW